jgi:hypothetical protein
LHETLLDNGFVADEPESIMIGAARRLAVDVRLPDGVALRRISEDADVRAMSAEVFGDSTEYSRPILELLRIRSRRR